MRRDARPSPLQRLLGVAVVVCLLLQPLLVPAHLVLEEHTYGRAGESVVHAHHGHAHAHPHPHPHGHRHDADEGSGGHPPHPAEDHLSEPGAPELSVPASFSVDLPLALPVEHSITWQRAVVWHALQVPRRSRDRPPPRAPAQPRAPPAIA